MLFKTILACLILSICLAQYYQAQHGVQYGVRLSGTTKAIYDFAMPESGYLYGQVQNPHLVQNLKTTTFKNGQKLSNGGISDQTNQTMYFFRGSLSKGENVRFEIFFQQYQYADPNQEQCIVTYFVHTKNQTENYKLNNNTSYQIINVYGPLGARTQLNTGPLNQPIIKYGTVSKFCYYIKLTPQYQRKGQLNVILKARQRDFDPSYIYWEKFAVVTKSISERQINDTRNWPEINDYPNYNQYQQNNLQIPVYQPNGFQHEYLAISVYVDSIEYTWNFYSFDIEILFPWNNKFLE